ncbi:MAG: DUF4340 domain-containing protein [Deltaproteobacteria bacterium]|nr:DUF4340 domain-containing protein [Deltaproteobacteria bacterium]
MKAFRGTLIATLALLVVVLVVFLVDRGRRETEVQESPALFQFEKADVVRVEIVRPDSTLVLAEQPDGQWIVEGPGWPAARSMVNRVKHQIHDLTARATVVEAPEAPELYGLGANAVHVTLLLRDDRKLEFLAGDPNPSNVSYYMQPLPGDTIYTVKKSAMDYYSLEPDAFRERRFASHDATDADRLEADLPGGRRLVLQRESDLVWRMEEPLEMLASREEVRRLLGRVTALKVDTFVEDHPSDLGRYGLDPPRARIRILFASREPIDLSIGAVAHTDDRFHKTRSYAYMMLANDFTVYTASDDLLEDYLGDPAAMRLKRFVRMRTGEVTDVTVDLQPGPGEDLSGVVTLLYRADKWLWADGVPVAGSTPSRVALRAAEIEADEIAAEQVGNPARWGFDRPHVTIRLRDREGTVRVLVVGGAAPPAQDPEGRDRTRSYARVDDLPTVWIVDDGVVDVAEDLVREYQRKAGADAASEERLDRVEEALGPRFPGPRTDPGSTQPPGTDP